MRITFSEKELNTSVVSSEQSESGLMGSVSGTVAALKEGWEFWEFSSATVAIHC